MRTPNQQTTDSAAVCQTRLIRLPLQHRSIPARKLASNEILGQALQQLHQRQTFAATTGCAPQPTVTPNKVLCSIPDLSVGTDCELEMAKAVTGQLRRAFAQSQKSNKKTSNSTRNKDRRAFPRRAGACQVTICRRHPSEPLTPATIQWLLQAGKVRGELQDISLGGICYVSCVAHQEQDLVFVRLNQRSAGATLDVCGTVVDVTEQQPGCWITRVELKQKLTIEQLHLFGAQFQMSVVG